MKKIEFNFENVGGLAEIYAIPPADLLRLRHDYVGDTYNVELRTRDNIIVIPVFGDRSFVFSEEKGQADGGDYWDVSIEGVIPSVNGLSCSGTTTGLYSSPVLLMFPLSSPAARRQVMPMRHSMA